MKLDKIISHFEHKSFEHRIDFIDNYSFKDNFSDYYYDFILNLDFDKNHLYISELIDLSGFLLFFDDMFLKKVNNFLLKSPHYIVKLSILDYFLAYVFYCKTHKKDVNYSLMYSLEKLLELRQRKIVKNQIYINLMFLFPNKIDFFFKKLLSSLKTTFDYRSYIRIFNILIEYSDFLLIDNKYKIELINLSKKNGKGKAVEISIQEYIVHSKLP